MPISINDQVAHPNLMWPTPTTQEIEHANMKLTKTGRRLTKDGKDSHSLNLADTVKMWPTPTSTERSGINPKTGKGAGLSKAVKMWPTPTQDSATDRTKKYSHGGKPLTLAVQEAEKMWPTPRARDYKDGQSVPPSRVKNPELATLGQKVMIEE